MAKLKAIRIYNESVKSDVDSIVEEKRKGKVGSSKRKPTTVRKKSSESQESLNSITKGKKDTRAQKEGSEQNNAER